MGSDAGEASLEEARAGRAAFFGVELDTEERLVLGDRNDSLAHSGRGGGLGCIRVGEPERLADGSTLPSRCAAHGPCRRTASRNEPEPGDAAVLLSSSATWRPRQIPSVGRPAAARSRAPRQGHAAQAGHHETRRPDARQHREICIAHLLGALARRLRSRRERELDRARCRLQARSQPCRTPFVLGSPSRPGARPHARPTALRSASAT